VSRVETRRIPYMIPDAPVIAALGCIR